MAMHDKPSWPGGGNTGTDVHFLQTIYVSFQMFKQKNERQEQNGRRPIENCRKRNLCGNHVGTHDRCV